MRQLHERFLDAVALERRHTSRRGLLAGGAKLAGGSALALTFAGAPVVGGLRSLLAQDFADDLEILNYALTLEHLEFAFYRDGLEDLGEDAFADEDLELPENIFERLGEIRDHEQDHVEFLTQTITDLGGTPVEEASYDFGYDDVAGFLEVAAALENTGVAAYAGAAPSIESGDILPATLGVHSVEARHAAYLNDLNGESPFPEAVDAPLPPDEVLAIAGPFITSAATPAAGSPVATGGGEEVAVSIDGFKFIPQEVTIAAGGTVTWTNMETVGHTATAEDETFDSGTLTDGDSFSFTFDTAGSYNYVCVFHDNMTGTVIVN